MMEHKSYSKRDNLRLGLNLNRGTESKTFLVKTILVVGEQTKAKIFSRTYLPFVSPVFQVPQNNIYYSLAQRLFGRKAKVVRYSEVVPCVTRLTRKFLIFSYLDD